MRAQLTGGEGELVEKFSNAQSLFLKNILSNNVSSRARNVLCRPHSGWAMFKTNYRDEMFEKFVKHHESDEDIAHP